MTFISTFLFQQKLVTNNELIATVNAAIVKRTVSAPVELCINDIIKVNKQLKLLKKAVSFIHVYTIIDILRFLLIHYYYV